MLICYELNCCGKVFEGLWNIELHLQIHVKNGNLPSNNWAVSHLCFQFVQPKPQNSNKEDVKVWPRHCKLAASDDKNRQKENVFPVFVIEPNSSIYESNICKLHNLEIMYKYKEENQYRNQFVSFQSFLLEVQIISIFLCIQLGFPMTQ